MEKSAKGVRGFILWNPINEQYFFRVYNPENRREYKDYKLQIEDLEIEIIAGGASLYESKLGNTLDWSSKVLKHG